MSPKAQNPKAHRARLFAVPFTSKRCGLVETNEKPADVGIEHTLHRFLNMPLRIAIGQGEFVTNQYMTRSKKFLSSHVVVANLERDLSSAATTLEEMLRESVAS